jgi:hypothetical protein
MSTTLGTDLIAVERSGTVYKQTKTDWDTAVSAGGSSSANGIIIKIYWGQITAGYNSSGNHKYGSGGSTYYSRSDSAGSYTKADSAGSALTSHRPNTQINVDGTWYSIGTQGTSVSGNSAAGPCNAYYRRHVISWSYTAAEMDTATGATSGSIRGIKIWCNSQPSSSYNNFPSFGVSLITYGSITTTTNYSGQTFPYSNFLPTTVSWTTNSWRQFDFHSSYYVSWS